MWVFGLSHILVYCVACVSQSDIQGSIFLSLCDKKFLSHILRNHSHQLLIIGTELQHGELYHASQFCVSGLYTSCLLELRQSFFILENFCQIFLRNYTGQFTDICNRASKWRTVLNLSPVYFLFAGTFSMVVLHDSISVSFFSRIKQVSFLAFDTEHQYVSDNCILFDSLN